MSISVHADFSQVRNIEFAMRKLEHMDKATLLDELGAEGESQTRRRIQDEKRAPDGTPWPAWSDEYAKTRHGNNSLLQSEGDLLDTIQHLPGIDEVEIGSNLIYAAHQNLGGEEIGSGLPERQYLGFNAENETDLKHVVEDFLHRQLQGL